MFGVPRSHLFPAAAFQVEDLKTFDMAHNRLTVVPDALGTLAALKVAPPPRYWGVPRHSLPCLFACWPLMKAAMGDHRFLVTSGIFIFLRHNKRCFPSTNERTVMWYFFRRKEHSKVSSLSRQPQGTND